MCTLCQADLLWKSHSLWKYLISWWWILSFTGNISPKELIDHSLVREELKQVQWFMCTYAVLNWYREYFCAFPSMYFMFLVVVSWLEIPQFSSDLLLPGDHHLATGLLSTCTWTCTRLSPASAPCQGLERGNLATSLSWLATAGRSSMVVGLGVF